MKIIKFILYVISAICALIFLSCTIVFAITGDFKTAFFCLLALLFFVPNTIVHLID